MAVWLIVSVVIGMLGWIAAAAAIGLWWGERGRRQDVQWATGVLRDRKAGSVTVESHPDPETEAIEEMQRQEKEAIRSGLKRQLEDAGRKVSPSRLDAEVDRMYSQLNTWAERA